ncbi:hypothetical protein L596_005754 [Steinernema carpocapsae]|uniref:Uncharacterized protein n=1 Tax=Steinernema carpocapsae TaxID=34508 RepID=A0A4U8V4F6_STECR|nr:hypothetical protein L596_005754 [Steinernema carpocapsae]
MCLAICSFLSNQISSLTMGRDEPYLTSSEGRNFCKVLWKKKVNSRVFRGFSFVNVSSEVKACSLFEKHGFVTYWDTSNL